MLIKSRGNKEYDVFLGSSWDNLVRVRKDKGELQVVSTSPSVHLTPGVFNTIKQSFEKRAAFFKGIRHA